MIKIFFATKNKSKYPYLKRFCELIDCVVITPYDINTAPIFKEEGKSIEENAAIKALNWSYHTETLVLADDSGFDIPALKGLWKKELSKRNVGGDGVGDDEKRKRLLRLMENFKGKDREIVWTEAIALAHKGKLLGSISLASNPGYILEKINNNSKIIDGAFLSNLEFKPQFNKVYSELTDKEIEENDKEMFQKFRLFVKEKIQEFVKNEK